MLRFEVYSQGKPVEGIDLSGAYVFGMDSVPVRADIVAAHNQITCMKQQPGAIGLAVKQQVGQEGIFLLTTTRLPERVEPYNLNIELARSQIMRIFRKWEDWFMFDYPEAEAVANEFKTIQSNFANALKVNVQDPAAASVIADEVLQTGLAFAEKLSLYHADLLGQKRSQVNDEPVKLGLKVNHRASGKPYLDVISQAKHVWIPAPWSAIEPQELKSDFQILDRWVDWASQNGKEICVGPLLDFRPGFLPNWLYVWQNDFNRFKQYCYNHIQQTVSRYHSKVKLWSITAGIEAINLFNLDFDQIAELVRSCCSLVKRLAPDAELMLELIQPFGEYYARDQHTIPPMLFADLAYSSDMQFDSFGIPIQMGVAEEGMFVRDLMQIGSLLDEFLPHGKKLHITACQVPSDYHSDPRDIWGGKASISRAGVWHRRWCQNLQAEWMQAIYRLANARPYISSITWQDAADVPGHYLPHGGLCDDKMVKKAAYKEFCALVNKTL